MTKPIERCDDNIVGFVFPTYFWGLPKIAERFITNINVAEKNAYMFAVVTYGEANTAVSGVISSVRTLLSKKGLTLSYGNKLHMVENYIPRYEINKSESFQKDVEKGLEAIADEIAEKKENEVKSNAVLNKLIYHSFPGRRSDCDKFFSVSSDCTGCGNCESVCPVKNVTIENGKPAFHHHCEHCLACIHACSANAIEWKKSTVGKSRYRNPNIALNELISFNCGD